MKLKSIILSAVMLAGAFCAYAQESDSPLWMRYSAISPDGTTIAFAYKGDIFTVPVGGGEARQITSNAAFDTRPIWSPDGSRIAFASYRTGGGDVYIVDKRGGEPVRLTTHSAKELPIVFRDNNTILYSAGIQPSAESMEFPGGVQVYAVSTEGGRPEMFSTLTMENIVFGPDGKTILYTDKKGYECDWRKHHTSSVTRDIWSCTFEGDNVMKDGTFTKLSSFVGEDRNPVYAPDGNSFYYLSEQDGSFNVWKRSLAGGDDVQVTDFDTNPVRFLSIAQNGTLCFGYDGEIYTLAEGGQPEKVEIEIISDKQDRDLIKNSVYRASGDIAVSKDGKQIAFIYRGDVYVTSDEYATTKRITNTSVQERNVDFAPDGRSIIYSSERDGLWQIYMTSIVNEDEKYFPYATELKEERVTNSDAVSFQPAFSPDGKEIAFLENRTAIRVINLDSKEVRTVMDGKYQYSYSDGDQWYQWSPDGKWILSNCIFIGGWNNQDVALIDASGNGVMHNLTNSGYSDGSAKWALDGKAMIWYSDRAGYRSHGSWGAHGDVYIMFFDHEAYKKFNMDEEQLALYEEAEKAKKEAEEKAKEEKDSKKKDKKSKDAKEEKAVESLKLDIENAEYRVARLTVNSSRLGDAVLSKDGSKLFYLASFEGGMDLWVHDLKKGETKILSKGAGYGSLILSDDGKSLYMNSRGIKKIDVNSGSVTSIDIEGEFEYRPYEEREYMFEHAWRQVEEKFYDPTIHGIDWKGYKDVYAKYLPYINNNFDFAEMLSELLGELNASHTGARYFGGGSQYPTASLGVFYDDTYEGDGLKIKEIIKRSPLYNEAENVVPGCVIEAIDGEKVIAGTDFYPMLEGKVGKRIRLAVYNPETNERFDVVVEGISYGYESSLLYNRWVERNRDIVEEISGGRIGYVHIEGMDSPSFRTLYSELLGRHRHKDAVVVDTRHNGGGWLHDDVVTLLSGKEYQQFAPRGQYIGSDPFNKWLKPSCMLVCEDNYSNAHGTPWVYQHLGIGKLVGAPVPGTMTAVWWETQMDGSIVFGIPQVGVRDLEGNYMENVQLNPDILIYNAPADVINGFDAQLKAATEHLMNLETENK